MNPLAVLFFVVVVVVGVVAAIMVTGLAVLFHAMANAEDTTFHEVDE